MEQHYLTNEQIAAFASPLFGRNEPLRPLKNTSEAYGLSSCTWMGSLLPRTLS